MKQQFTINDEDFEVIKNINKVGGDKVMYITGGIPLGSGKGGEFQSLQDKINDFWKAMGKRDGFDWETVKGITDRTFEAEVIEQTLKEQQ